MDAAAPRLCADATDSLELPTPAWEQDADVLTPPAGDRAVALLSPRPAWAPQLARLDGWPRRPTVVVELEGDASAVDAAGVHFFDQAGDPTTPLVVPVTAWLEGSHTLVVVPDDPFPDGVERVLLRVDAGAVTGATPLPACDATGAPDPAYAAAAALLGTSDAFVLPFRLTRRAGDLRALHDALDASPVLTVTESAPLDLDALVAEDAPSADVRAALRLPVVDGRLALPAYQDADSVFVLDADGVPTAQGTSAPGFTVMLPSVGSAPYPYVLFQHGGGQHRHVALHIVGTLLEAGFAVVAIDLPAHGDRAGAGGGSDLEILDFDSPLRSRDNLRQASADHLAVLTGIAALNDTLQPTFGDAAVLDASRAYYEGLSLGGITGSFTFTASPELHAAALFVAGGGYREIVGDGLFKLILSDVVHARGAGRQATLGLVDALLAAADPLAHAAFEAHLGRERPLLLFEAIDDPVVPNPATDRWARAFGADLALPSQHAVPELSEVALPFAGSPTRLLVQAPMVEIPGANRHGLLIEQGYSAEAVAHCFGGLIDGGSCELIDTAWAAH